MILMLLAMHKAGTTDGAAVAEAVIEVANAPGEPIGPNDIEKAFKILSEGGDIDYIGGSDVELIGPGESGGSYREIMMDGGKVTEVKFH